MKKSEKYFLLVSLLICAITGIIFVPAIPQNETYHNFADKRVILEVANFMDVISNVPFVIVGIIGITFCAKKLFKKEERTIFLCYFVFFCGVFLTGFGSAFYHLSPTTSSLVWDRLPMTIAFTSLFSAIVSERINKKLGFGLLFPLLGVGVCSIAYWYVSECYGAGDLRFYALVQFVPLTFIPIIIMLFPSKYTRGKDLLLAVGFYGLSKIFETLDKQIFELLGGIVSGHTLKHLSAAFAIYLLLRMLKRRELKRPKNILLQKNFQKNQGIYEK